MCEVKSIVKHCIWVNISQSVNNCILLHIGTSDFIFKVTADIVAAHILAMLMLLQTLKSPAHMQANAEQVQTSAVT